MKTKVEMELSQHRIGIRNFEENLFKGNTKNPGTEKDAVITHFIQNLGHPSEASFKNDALIYLSELTGIPEENRYQLNELLAIISQTLIDIPFPPNPSPKFTFIDLFAGIGGFRMAMQNLGGKCVFTSEWDKNAKITYLKNYGKVPFGDITDPQIKTYIPENFDLLCAGFPCQAFSIAGKRGGFEDTRGTFP